MKRKIVICVIVAIVIGLVVVGVSTDVLAEKVFPILKKVVKAIPVRFWTGLLFRLLILTGLMGYVTKVVGARKERFLNGEIEYNLAKNYSLVVGYDFQTRPLIKRLLDESAVKTWKPKNKIIAKCVAIFRWLSDLCVAIFRWLLALPPTNCILLITDRDVCKIRAEMATELTKEERKRVLYMRRDLASASTYANLRIRGARAIYLMGDEGVPGRDGIILQASKVIAEKVLAEIKAGGDALPKRRQGEASKSRETSCTPVKVYLQFEDPEFYSQMCSEHLPMDPETYPNDYKDEDKRGKVIPETVLFDIEVFNYYDSWVWKCWSEKDSADGGSPYLPLRFKKDAERVELFVIGAGKVAKAVVDSAITLMNYGDDTRHCRMTVVSDRSSEILPPAEVIDSLPELEVIECSPRDLKGTVAARMLEAVADEKRAVTIAIVEDAPEKSVRTYMRLPFAVRCCDDLSVLMWMGAQTRNLPDKSLVTGVGDHKPQIRYFGMSDCLPWYRSNRQMVGADVNYYYSVYEKLQGYAGSELAEAAMRLWDGHSAFDEWNRSARWCKSSSINSAGSFKEKAAIIAGRALTPELQLLLLKAEHNRWWAERLMSNWRVGPRDNGRRRHPNLVPFEELDEVTKNIDKINIAAMVRQGFLMTAT